MEFELRKRVAIRLAVALLVGLASMALVGLTVGWRYVPTVGWIATAFTYLAWTWSVILPMDAAQTRAHVEPEDPPRGWVTDTVLLVASLASLGGVGQLLVASSKTGNEKVVAAAVGVVSIVAAWCVVHTVFSIRYADVYYSTTGGGIDFNGDEEPRFVDFFYLAFTIGMTYQVSDTNLKTGQIRGIALCQAVLSYVFGTVIIATTINLVVGLSNTAG